MKFILIALLILTGDWMFDSTIGATSRRVQVESEFSTLRNHAKSVLTKEIEGKEVNEFLTSIESVEQSIHLGITRSSIPSIAAFTIALVGTAITLKKRNEA